MTLLLLAVFLLGVVSGATAVTIIVAPKHLAECRRLQSLLDDALNAPCWYSVRTSDKEIIDPPLYLVWDHDEWRLDRSMKPSRFSSIEQADAARKVFNRSQKERKHLIIEEADK